MIIDTREMGRRGGKASAAKLSAHQRAEKARKAAAARWSKRRQTKTVKPRTRQTPRP